MPQLLSHLFLIVLLYRRLKLFFKEWNAWYIMFIIATYYFFCMFAIYATSFWSFLSGWACKYLTCCSYAGLSLFILHIFIIFVYRMKSYDTPTEWWWGYLFWYARTLYCYSSSHPLKAYNKKTTHYLWFETHRFPLSAELTLHGFLILGFKTILYVYFLFIMCNYCSISSFIYIGIYWYNAYSFWSPCLFIDHILLCYLWYTFFCFYRHHFRALNFHDLNPIGLCYKFWFIIDHSSEWLHADVAQRVQHFSFKRIFTTCKHLYDIPNSWCSWYQGIPDSATTLHVLFTPVHYTWIWWTLFTTTVVQQNKRCRYNEFRVEQPYSSIFIRNI